RHEVGFASPEFAGRVRSLRVARRTAWNGRTHGGWAMLSDEVRARIARLSALTRSSGADRPHDLSAPRPQAQPLAPQPATAAAAADPAARPLDLSCELSQAQVCTTSAGEHLLFRRPLAALSPAVATLMPGLSCAPDSAAAIEHPELAAVAEHFPAG